jgi:DNA-directed RNA polymerase subunit RPC12/RpoP
MAEFKFTCPQCKQHIQCDSSYVGSQINCPACRQAIIVPPAPPMVAAPGERTFQIKASALRKTALVGLGTLLAVGIAAVVIYYTGNSTRAIWTEWSALDGNENQWSLANGKIHAHSVDGESILASEKEFGDVIYSATVSTTNREATLAIRMQDAGNGYLILFAPARTPVPWNRSGFVAVVKKVSGTETTLVAYNNRKLSAIGQTAKIKVIARGSSIEVQLNGAKILHASDSTFATGHIGLRIFGDSSYPCDATFSKMTFH